MSNSMDTDDPDAISTILSRTQRLLKVEAAKEDSAFHQAQLLLSEYMEMLRETQSENARLRQLLGSYIDGPAARRNVPASAMIATLRDRVAALTATVTTLRRALEKIRACESAAAQRKPGEIAAHALRSIAPATDRRASRSSKRKPGATAPSHDAPRDSAAG